MAGSSDYILRSLAIAVINVAARHPTMRGPWVFDEERLQQDALNAHRWLTDHPKPNCVPTITGE